jgi:hypothetical protein
VAAEEDQRLAGEQYKAYYLAVLNETIL